jgi:hypothetical protein
LTSSIAGLLKWALVSKRAKIRLKNRSLFADSMIMGLKNDPVTNDRLPLILDTGFKVGEFRSLGNDFVL